MKWSVYYNDGTTFTSEDGPPEDAPRQNVALIVQYYNGERKVEWKSDTYCWELDCWVPHDRFGCERYIDKTKHPVRLIGYCLPNDEFWAIYKLAKEA